MSTTHLIGVSAALLARSPAVLLMVTMSPHQLHIVILRPGTISTPWLL
jgi:hypothetical protein